MIKAECSNTVIFLRGGSVHVYLSSHMKCAMQGEPLPQGIHEV
jgi:hypothetical protein